MNTYFNIRYEMEDAEVQHVAIGNVLLNNAKNLEKWKFFTKFAAHS